MEDARGSVWINGTKPNRSLLRYIDRQLRKWAPPEDAIEPGDWAPIRYRVSIDGEAEHFYACHLEVQWRESTWRASAGGRTAQESFIRAMRRLMPAETLRVASPSETRQSVTA